MRCGQAMRNDADNKKNSPAAFPGRIQGPGGGIFFFLTNRRAAAGAGQRFSVRDFRDAFAGKKNAFIEALKIDTDLRRSIIAANDGRMFSYLAKTNAKCPWPRFGPWRILGNSQDGQGQPRDP
jgi:hypothetical protein